MGQCNHLALSPLKFRAPM